MMRTVAARDLFAAAALPVFNFMIRYEMGV